MGGFDLWPEDIMAVPPKPEIDSSKPKRVSTRSLSIKEVGEVSDPKHQRSMTMSASSVTPGTPITPTTPLSARKENAWMSVFNPGSNLSPRGGTVARVFDKTAHPESPSVHDWFHMCNGAWE